MELKDREEEADNIYKELSSEDIYIHFLNEVYPNISKYDINIAELKECPRYSEDAAYRATVDFIVIILKTNLSSREKYVGEIVDLIDRATALELWHLVANSWNILGGFYRELRMNERAIECYSRVANIEKEHGLSNITFVAYYNLATLYYELEMYEKAISFLKKSNEELDLHPPSAYRYTSKIYNNYAMMLQVLYRIKDLDEAGKVYNKLKSIDIEAYGDYYKYLFYQSEVFYKFLLYQNGLASLAECRQSFLEAGKYLDENNAYNYAPYLYTYVNLCILSDVELRECEEELHKIEKIVSSGTAAFNVPLIDEIIVYYEYLGNREKVFEYTKMYADGLEKMINQFKEQQANSIEILETLLFNTQTEDEMGRKNLELKMLYRESVEAKKELENAYQRIENISSLGRKLISTLDINEVVKHFNQILSSYTDFDTFALLVHDSEENVLKSLMIYNGGIMKPEIKVSCDDEESYIARCYRLNKVEIISDSYEEKVKRLNIDDMKIMRSAVYLPLSVEDKVIGVYTLQHSDKYIYNDKLGFLMELTPYVSIALNNAIKSWMLEKEIESHIVTQKKLKAANRSLERISLVDGLTYISSRRFFEKKIIEMLELANSKSESISTLMIDIDNFKDFNDTYGHLEGDRALRAVARIFKNEMRAVNGLAARFGGEEFIGACRGLSFEESFDLGERIRNGVFKLGIENKKAKLNRLTVSVGISIGYGLGAADKSLLMRLADEQLYQAKKRGKNRVNIREYTREN